MSKSLQDQLLALGLAKEKASDRTRDKTGDKIREKSRHTPNHPPRSGQHSKTQKEANKPRSQRNAARDPKSTGDISLEQAYRIRASVEKTEKQKAHERKMEEERKRAVINRQIRAIIDAHRLNLADAEEARYFMYKDRIRKVHVNAEQLQQLNEGQLGVVYLGGGYHILASEHIETVRNISPTHVPDLLAGADDDDDLGAAFEQSSGSSE